jgi:flagellar L-ring protein precursor FlgH
MISKRLLCVAIASTALLSACKTTGGMPNAEEFNKAQPMVSYAQNGVRSSVPLIDNTQGKLNARETSLWSSSPKSLFGDRRASQAGDILTVLVEIDDEAEINNSVTQDRQNTENFGMNAFFGLPETLNGILPAGASTSPAVDLNRTRNISGDGTIRRGERITLRLAVQVIDVLPNGYLQLAGQQKIMVNNEIRHLQVSGLIRTQDISRQNVITYDKMADARIYYGGKGQVSDAVKPRLGNKVLQTLLPF